MALVDRGISPTIIHVVVVHDGGTISEEPQNEGLQRTRPGFARSLAAEPYVLRTVTVAPLIFR
jgi:hypothetical protein